MALARPAALVVALAAVLAVLGFLAGPAVAAGKTGQVTVFWGRHKEEGSLREACDSRMYTMVIISFLNVYGHGRYQLDLSGHSLYGIGDDIKHCQFVGVPVSLSIGGYTGDYGLPTNKSALDLFDYLWNSYFGGSRKGVHRPFGDAWLDGVDLYLEHGTPAEHYDVLARELAKHNIRGGPGKPLHLTATPRCTFPDTHVSGALATGIFERIHVRFYDDRECNVNLRWEQAWDRWTAAYPASRIYFGVPVSEKVEGYVFPKDLYYGVVPVVEKAANYGGFMLWEHYADKQSNYSSYVKAWA